MIDIKETAELHNLLGDVEERAGNRIGAAGEYQRAARMEPRSTCSTGETTCSRSVRSKRPFGTQPRNALAQFYYAMSLWKGQPPESPPADTRRVEALLRQAVTLDRRLAKGFLELGILLSDEKRYQDAIAELQRAITLEPDLAQAHYRLAQAYQRTGQKELAARELAIFERLNERKK